MKHINIKSLSLIVFLFTFQIVSPAQGSIKPSCPNSIRGFANTTFNVDIVVGDPTPVNNLFSASLILTMTNYTDITYNGASPGTFLPGNPFLSTSFQTDRVVLVITSIPQAGSASGSGTLIKVSFRITNDITTNKVIYFNIIKAFGYKQNGDTIRLVPTETSITLTSITSVNIEKPIKFELGQNFPNPFNPGTSIAYSIAKPGFVDLSVFNITGEKIITLVNSYHDIGNYKVNFSLNDIRELINSSSGVLLYRLTTPDFSETKKMIALK